MFIIRWEMFLPILMIVLTEMFPVLYVIFSVFMETLPKLLTTETLRILMEALH